MSSNDQTRAEPLPEERFQPVAGVLAIVLPGLGHMFLGEVRRGVLIALGVLGLFAGGLLIGGIDVVDSREDRIWFLGQVLVGPIAYGVDWYHQHRIKAYDLGPEGQPVVAASVPARLRSVGPNEKRVIESVSVEHPGPTGWPVPVETELPVIRAAGPGEVPPNTKSLGRMNELGTLFCAIAGMLNLIVVLDAFLHRPGGGLAPGADGPRQEEESADETGGEA